MRQADADPTILREAAKEEQASGRESSPPRLPPRPNLGPEPWPESTGSWTFILWLAPALLAPVVIWARRRRKLAAIVPPTAGDHEPEKAPILVYSLRIRSALVDRFDPSWAAKTTEEIAAMPELLREFGEGRTQALVGFLERADRVKFGGQDPDDQGEDWMLWATSFLDDLRSAGETSRIKGR